MSCIFCLTSNPPSIQRKGDILLIKPAGICLLFYALSASAQIHSNPGEMLWKQIKCGGVDVELMVNHRTVAQPTLFINRKAILLQDGPDYSGLKCVTHNGAKKIGFVESMGNAYASYKLVDLTTRRVSEITYQQARKIGF